jgi:preprotein translocase subunit SecF
MKVKISSLVCFSIVFSVLLLGSLSLTPLSAEPALTVSFYKNNGYNMGNDMQGHWTINTQVSQNTTHVEFYLDNQLQLNDTQAPFAWEFNTENYTEGLHTFKVVAYDSAEESAVVERQRNFVGFPWAFIAGIIALVIASFVVALAVSAYKIKKAAKEKRAQMGY